MSLNSYRDKSTLSPSGYLSRMHARPVSRYRLLLFFCALLLFLWGEGLKLSFFQVSDRYAVLPLAAIFLLIIAAGRKMLFFPDQRIFRNFYFRSICGIIVIVLIPIALTSILFYEQPLSILIRRPIMYAGFLVFPLLYLGKVDKRFLEIWINIFVGMSVFAATLISFASYSPDIASLFNPEAISSRFGKIRIAGVMGAPILISLFYCISSLFNEKHKISSFISLFLCTALLAYPTIFINLTRGKIIGIFLTLIFFVIWFLPWRKTFLFVLTILTILFFSFVFDSSGSFSDVFYKVFDSVVQEKSQGAGTIGVRMRGANYFFEEFRKTNLIGMGMVSASESFDNPIIKAKLRYGFSLNDLGFLAVLFQFGFPAIVLALIVLKRIFRELTFVIRYGDSSFKCIAIGIFIYFVYQIVLGQHMFFWGKNSFYYGMLFYFVWRMKDLVDANERPCWSVKKT